jgi:hypothetical protein
MPTNIVVDISDPANQDAWGLHPIPGGVWAPGAYVAGSVASHDGSLYFANKQTTQEPGAGADWTLLVSAPWAPVIPWSPGLVCSADAPVTVVTHGGTIYFCVVSHTSAASFEPDKWLATVSATAGSLVEIAGGWNANTNTPALASGVGDNGAVYRVTVAGDATLDGVSSWNVDDLAVFMNGVWRKLRGQTVKAKDIADASAAGRALLTAADVAAQRVALRVDQATLVADAGQAITAAMSRVVHTSLTASRVDALPPATSFSDGQELLVCDESGDCSPTKTITIAAAGIDTINGSGSYVLAEPYAGVRLVKASATKWTAFAQNSIPRVQQGTGVGQLANLVKLGWSGAALKCTIDGSDLGLVWTDSVAAKSLATSGYQKLPSGLVIQWGQTVITTDASGNGEILYPTAMPTETLIPLAWNGDSGSNGDRVLSSYITGYPTATGFSVHVNGFGAGALVRVNWIALGH